jgi:hypothetical protein
MNAFYRQLNLAKSYHDRGDKVLRDQALAQGVDAAPSLDYAYAAYRAAGFDSWVDRQQAIAATWGTPDLSGITALSGVVGESDSGELRE